MEYIFEKLFCEESGQGYPRERAVPEKRNKKILDEVKKLTYCQLGEILPKLDRALLVGALGTDGFEKHFWPNCKDQALAFLLKELL